MPRPTPEELARAYPERDFLVDEAGGSSAYVVAIHAAFYSFVAARVSGGRVLDAGCGTGLGADLVAPKADRTVGIDIKDLVLNYAEDRYGRPGLEFLKMDVGDLRFNEQSFDVVIANELLEHLPDHRPFLDEAVRVLSPGGVFYCATVNRVHTFGSGENPLNRNHFREFDATDFRTELERYFSDVEILGQGFPDGFGHYMKSRPARSIELVLTALKVKHRIPASWRAKLRSLLTGYRVAEVSPGQFPVTDVDVENSLYLVGIGRRKAATD